MKRILTATLCFAIVGSYLSAGQTSWNRPTEPTADSRAFLKKHLEEKDKQSESDADAILAFMDLVIRHESPTPASVAAIIARSNSKKTAGMFDKDLLKKLAATYAYDLLKYEEIHTLQESEQDKRIADLESKVKDLQTQVNLLRDERKKTQ
jgi:hypothetical protein